MSRASLDALIDSQFEIGRAKAAFGEGRPAEVASRIRLAVVLLKEAEEMALREEEARLALERGAEAGEARIRLDFARIRGEASIILDDLEGSQEL